MADLEPLRCQPGDDGVVTSGVEPRYVKVPVGSEPSALSEVNPSPQRQGDVDLFAGHHLDLDDAVRVLQPTCAP
jgi:hypothetical protein